MRNTTKESRPRVEKDRAAVALRKGKKNGYRSLSELIDALLREYSGGRAAAQPAPQPSAANERLLEEFHKQAEVLERLRAKLEARPVAAPPAEPIRPRVPPSLPGPKSAEVVREISRRPRPPPPGQDQDAKILAALEDRHRTGTFDAKQDAAWVVSRFHLSWRKALELAEAYAASLG